MFGIHILYWRSIIIVALNLQLHFDTQKKNATTTTRLSNIHLCFKLLEVYAIRFVYVCSLRCAQT